MKKQLLYFSIFLLIVSCKQEENKDDEVLLFEFSEEEVYAIQYSILKDKAFEESQKLKSKYD